TVLQDAISNDQDIEHRRQTSEGEKLDVRQRIKVPAHDRHQIVGAEDRQSDDRGQQSSQTLALHRRSLLLFSIQEEQEIDDDERINDAEEKEARAGNGPITHFKGPNADDKLIKIEADGKSGVDQVH